MKPKKDRGLLARKLEYLRNMSNLTQDQLCEILGISRATYANYEVGRSAPKETLLRQLAKVFRVDPEELLQSEQTPLMEAQGRLNDSSYAGARGLFSLPEDEKQLLGLYRLLDKDQQEQLLSDLSETLRNSEE